MPSRNPAALAIDHTHCRAICDEIGERLRNILLREALEVPPRLLALIDKFAKLEIEEVSQLECAPSIVPSIDEMSFPQPREHFARIKQSTYLALPATNRGSISAGSRVEPKDRQMAGPSRE
jgi:hypothetical protein